MRNRRGGRRAAVAVTTGTLLTVGVLLTAGSLPAAGSQAGATTAGEVHAARAATVPAQAARAARAPRTLVTLKMPGCEGCKVQPVRWIRGSDHDWWGKAKRVRNSEVHWRIRTTRTRGLTFYVLRDPDASFSPALNAVPLVVARYRGKAVGSTVSTAAASSARRATPCLAGTTKARWTRKVTTQYHRVDDPSGPGTARIPRYYFKHTQRATKPYSRAFRGTLAAQDVYGCRG